MEKVRVEISPSGEVKVSVTGVKGKGCKALTKPLEDALGDVEATNLTREAFEHEPATVAHKHRA